MLSLHRIIRSYILQTLYSFRCAVLFWWPVLGLSSWALPQELLRARERPSQQSLRNPYTLVESFYKDRYLQHPFMQALQSASPSTHTSTHLFMHVVMGSVS
ncbi:hypothetical protein F4815DRAFT_489759 [Daldinia loculata]|nr:hypothetical protein F4815DRAFT_489759 [Daldinia loculata]